MSENLDITSTLEPPTTKNDGVPTYTHQKPNTGETPKDPREANKELSCAFDAINPTYGSITLSEKCFPEGAKKLISQEQVQLLKNLGLSMLYTPGKNENESSIYIERKDWEYISIKTGDRYFGVSGLTIRKDAPAKISQEGEGILFEQGPYSYHIPKQEIKK